jgi:2,5-diamino-6-(ribosylamino)-4(3H)-pyrimidinone 5'-phosphate reductase
LQSEEWPEDSISILTEHGGKFIYVEPKKAASSGRGRFDWHDILDVLSREGLSSLMVEGGAQIINSLLDSQYHSLVDSVIVTIAPTWLGEGGVVVSPARAHDEQGVPIPAARLSDVKWHPFGEDVVLCGRLDKK